MKSRSVACGTIARRRLARRQLSAEQLRRPCKNGQLLAGRPPANNICSLYVNLRFFNGVTFEFNTVKGLSMLGNNWKFRKKKLTSNLESQLAHFIAELRKC